MRYCNALCATSTKWPVMGSSLYRYKWLPAENKSLKCTCEFGGDYGGTRVLTQLNEDRLQKHLQAISLDPKPVLAETCCLSLIGTAVACLCPSMLLIHVQTCQIEMNEMALWDVQGLYRGTCRFCACFVQTILSELISFLCCTIVI